MATQHERDGAYLNKLAAHTTMALRQNKAAQDAGVPGDRHPGFQAALDGLHQHIHGEARAAGDNSIRGIVDKEFAATGRTDPGRI